MEFFHLLIIGIVNIFYNFGMGVYELTRLGRHPWWWRLRGWLLFYYIFDSPFAAINREGPRAPVALENLIYGETPCITMSKILQEISPAAGDHFIDLGCGRGLTVFFVRLYYQIPATGVEVIPTFVRRGQQIARRLNLTKIDFVRENLAWLTLDQIGQGTIFFLAGTTFEEELLIKIAARLELLPPGVRLITVSEAFPSDQFRVVACKSYHFTWGKSEVYFHEKVA
jgi:SAM-dependent methyltransferase